MLGGEVVGTVGIGGQQDLVGDDIDAPQQAVGVLLDFFGYRAIDQLGPPVTDLAHAEIEIVINLFPGQRFEVEVVSNAFAQLPNRLLREIFIEFRLAEQNDLQQLVLIGFEVGQQADFLERFQRHALRLFDEQYHLPVFHVPLEQIILQAVHNLVLARVPRHGQRELVGDDEQYILGGYARIGDIDDFYRLRQLEL